MANPKTKTSKRRASKPAAPIASKPKIRKAKPVQAAAAKESRPDSKQAKLIALLRRPEGATIAQVAKTFGWQAHTVRGVFSGALKKKLGLTVTSDKAEGGVRVYRIA
jgi:hypothetical protein